MMRCTNNCGVEVIYAISANNASGRRAIIPMKMISEIPFPKPRSVICSPSHIRNTVPAVSKTIDEIVNIPTMSGATTAAELVPGLSIFIVTPQPCKAAMSTVR